MSTHLLQAATTAAKAAAAAAALSGPTWTDIATAVGACVAATAALGALFFAAKAARAAGRQVAEAQKQVSAAREQTRQAGELERERSRAYVVVFAEPSLISTELLEVVIANMGTTGAHDVRVRVDPPLVRAPDNEGEAPELVGLPEVLPFLAPGQRWSTLWDSSVVHDGDSESPHMVSITYRDIFDLEHSATTVLDWSMFDQRLYTNVYGVHHAAKALRAMEKTLSAWSKSTKVVKVATYDGPQRDKQQAADLRQRARRHEDVVAQVLPDPDQGPRARMDGTIS